MVKANQKSWIYKLQNSVYKYFLVRDILFSSILGTLLYWWTQLTWYNTMWKVLGQELHMYRLSQFLYNCTTSICLNKSICKVYIIVSINSYWLCCKHYLMIHFDLAVLTIGSICGWTRLVSLHTGMVVNSSQKQADDVHTVILISVLKGRQWQKVFHFCLTVIAEIRWWIATVNQKNRPKLCQHSEKET